MGNTSSAPADAKKSPRLSGRRVSIKRPLNRHSSSSRRSVEKSPINASSNIDIKVADVKKADSLEKLRDELNFFTMISDDMREEIYSNVVAPGEVSHFPQDNVVPAKRPTTETVNPIFADDLGPSPPSSDTNEPNRLSSQESVSHVEFAGDNEDDVDITSQTSQKSNEEMDPTARAENQPKYPFKLVWYDRGNKVFVTGTFVGWKTMIPLEQDGEFKSVTLELTRGTHRLAFVVDGEMECANHLSTASDSMGNFVNYIEVNPLDSDPGIEHDGAEVPEVSAELEYSKKIPPIFTEEAYSDHLIGSEIINPPHLPAQLDSCILNSSWTYEKEDSSVLPPPNHVVINHLATTAIKHRVLSVASTSRYSNKSITQIFYAPLPEHL